MDEKDFRDFVDFCDGTLPSVDEKTFRTIVDFCAGRVADQLMDKADDLGCWQHTSEPLARVIDKANAAFCRRDLADQIWDEDTTIIWNDGGSDGLE